jgi:hypothetical protein
MKSSQQSLIQQTSSVSDSAAMEIAMSEEDKNEDDGSIEVTLVDASPTETAAVEKEETVSARADRDLEEHSESVRKRIDKLTYKVREAERREQAALEFAKGLKGQLDTYQDRAQRLDKSLVQEFDNRLKTQEKMVREELRRAIDEGNIDAQIDAQSSLAALAVENDKLRQTRARREHDETQRAAVAAAPPPAQRAPQAPQPDPKARSWAERNDAMAGVKLLVNTTTQGMYGQPALDVHLDALPASAMVSDAIYIPLETPLLEQARKRGHVTVNGLGMLLNQAVPAFEAWFGVRPEVTAELRAVVQATF